MYVPVMPVFTPRKGERFFGAIKILAFNEGLEKTQKIFYTPYFDFSCLYPAPTHIVLKAGTAHAGFHIPSWRALLWSSEKFTLSRDFQKDLEFFHLQYSEFYSMP